MIESDKENRGVLSTVLNESQDQLEIIDAGIQEALVRAIENIRELREKRKIVLDIHEQAVRALELTGE
ncbi:MAG: hypothetical protein ACM3SY_19910 [Candidatus Omnitrophota bacterium]